MDINLKFRKEVRAGYRDGRVKICTIIKGRTID